MIGAEGTTRRTQGATASMGREQWETDESRKLSDKDKKPRTGNSATDHPREKEGRFDSGAYWAKKAGGHGGAREKMGGTRRVRGMDARRWRRDEDQDAGAIERRGVGKGAGNTGHP